ncbi:hypothetical protein GCM10022281_19880 [Sphingomonas rosea]|uniref:Glycosyltransferase 2-like domain-containing protein n=1 Tax=Sphingomonas rosea TaxID=335605 RepID=A0ABP7UAD8_9SPHN
MKLSVVILVYNLERYVGAAIGSVLAQTRAADEIIVIDDASTDGSAAVVAGYGERVRYERLPQNVGALAAALTGVRMATGDVVCMLDGDDVWAANKLAVVEREFTADPTLVLLSHDHVRVDTEGKPTGERDETHRNIARILAQHDGREARSAAFRDTILAQKGYWLGSAYAFRRDAFDADLFARQLAELPSEMVRAAYLDLTLAPFLVLTAPEGHVGYAGDTHFLYRIHHGGSLAGDGKVEGAIRSVAKGRAINRLILHLLERNGASDAYRERRRLLIAEYDFLESLYRRRAGTALRHWTRLAAKRWDRHALARETVRMAAVLLLGPARFLRMKHRRTFD